MQTAESSADTPLTPPLRKRRTFADDPPEVNRERARRASQAKALLARTGKYGGMSKEKVIKHVESLLKDKETPVQYHAALISQLADLNRWKRDSTDEKSHTQLDEMVNGWKREDAGEYAGIMNSAIQCSANQVRSDNGAICQPVSGSQGPLSAIAHEPACPTRGHVCPACSCAPVESSTQVAATDPTPGGSPPAESATGALDPLSRHHSPEKPSQVTDSQGVSGIPPLPDMWEEE